MARRERMERRTEVEEKERGREGGRETYSYVRC